MVEQTIIPPSDEPEAAPTAPYAGVIRRFLAMGIDRLIVNVVLVTLTLPLALMTSLGGAVATPLALPIPAFGAFTLWLFFLLADWIYFAWLESSERGATLGKRWLGMRVLDAYGQRLTFRRASLRYVCKYLSALPLMLGYFLAFFTKRTQALHDLIAETIVVRVR